MSNTKYDIEDCKRIAAERGGECLSIDYINCTSKMKWRCEHGHEWEAPFYYVINKNSWCPYCSRKKKHDIEYCQKIASERGGECLATEYIDNRTKLKWRCKHGHEWEAPLINIVSGGTWCPKCGHIRIGKSRLGVKSFHSKITLEDCKELAKSKGGKCLSTDYDNSSSKMKWKCEHGHEWEASLAAIKYNKSWCPVCARVKKITIEECQELAESKGGECLSEEYINAHTKLKWKCKHGHEWEAPWSNIKNRDSWCSVCANKNKYRLPY